MDTLPWDSAIDWTTRSTTNFFKSVMKHRSMESPQGPHEFIWFKNTFKLVVSHNDKGELYFEFGRVAKPGPIAEEHFTRVVNCVAEMLQAAKADILAKTNFRSILFQYRLHPDSVVQLTKPFDDWSAPRFKWPFVVYRNPQPYFVRYHVAGPSLIQVELKLWKGIDEFTQARAEEAAETKKRPLASDYECFYLDLEVTPDMSFARMKDLLEGHPLCYYRPVPPISKCNRLEKWRNETHCINVYKPWLQYGGVTSINGRIMVFSRDDDESIEQIVNDTPFRLREEQVIIEAYRA